MSSQSYPVFVVVDGGNGWRLRDWGSCPLCRTLAGECWPVQLLDGVAVMFDVTFFSFLSRAWEFRGVSNTVRRIIALTQGPCAWVKGMAWCHPRETRLLKGTSLHLSPAVVVL